MNTSLRNECLAFSSHLGNFGEEKGLDYSDGIMRLALQRERALSFSNMPGLLLPNF